MKKLLFVCNENGLRSSTAEEVFSRYDEIHAVGCGTNSDSETPISDDHIEWSDTILFMEESHKNNVSKLYKEILKSKQLVRLGIPDNYDRMQPEPITLVKAKIDRVIHL